ncbi:hypothetical protein Tco_1161776 [Tanacetum coccineum]
MMVKETWMNLECNTYGGIVEWTECTEKDKKSRSTFDYEEVTDRRILVVEQSQDDPGGGENGKQDCCGSKKGQLWLVGNDKNKDDSSGVEEKFLFILMLVGRVVVEGEDKGVICGYGSWDYLGDGLGVVQKTPTSPS